MLRNLLVLLAAAMLVASLVGFVEYREPPRCTHGISSAGPVTIVDGKLRFERKTYTRACLL